MNKKFSIKNAHTKVKITLFSVMMLVLIIIIAGCGLFATSEINTQRKESYDYAKSQYYMVQAFGSFCNVKVHLKNILFLYYDDPTNLQAQKARITKYKDSMNENLGYFEENAAHLSQEVTAQYRKVKSAMDAWMQLAEQDMSMATSGKQQQALDDHMKNGITYADTVEAEMTTLMNMLDNLSTEKDQWVEKVNLFVRSILLGISVLAVILACVFASMIIKQITIPVEKMLVAAQKMALGDVEVDCQKIADDDLGELLDNFQLMVDAVKAQAVYAQRLASGDMTGEMTPRSDKDLLGIAVKKLTEDQNRTLSNVKESTMQVTAGAEQVAMASQNLAQGATEQASALEQVTVSVDDIAQRTKLNAAEASKANDLVHTVKKTAVFGNSQMKDMKEAMNDINRTSENISKIIKVIDDIAFQTNILALNAAVEAARAGAHGKGFSVVAEEVRSLAAKSASAASETAEMIEDTIRKVQNGTQLANETEKSLDEIVNQINQVVELIDSIATASNNQATAVSQIDQALGQVSQVVQTNSATSEECAAASDELSNQAANLRKLMANFKLSAGRGGSFDSSADLGFSAGSNYNDQIISLDGDYGKY